MFSHLRIYSFIIILMVCFVLSLPAQEEQEEKEAGAENNVNQVQQNEVLIPLPKGPQPLNKNLLSNGSFDNTNDALKGWFYKYDLPGESWYYDNHKHVDVVKEYKGRKNVVRLWGDITKITDRGEGVQIDSEFIPYEKNGRYRLSLYACTTGPDCRVYFIGYCWKPGVKRDHIPLRGEIRRVYKSQVMRIESKDGAFTGAPKTWKKGVAEFPMEKPSAEAQKHLNDIDFISAHLIAIGGNGGELFFDDVVLEKIK